MKKVRLMIANACLLFVCITVSSFAYAQSQSETPRVPTISQIEAHFNERAESWEVIPPEMLLAFIAVFDPDFLETNRPEESSVTRTFAINMVSPMMPVDERRAAIEQVSRDLVASFTRDEIALYIINGAYTGNLCYGASAAASYYFGRNLQSLGVSEFTTLALLMNRPSLADQSERSIQERTQLRNQALAEMLEQQSITRAELQSATETRAVLPGVGERCPVRNPFLE